MIETSDDALRYGRELLVGDRVRLRALRDEDLPVLESWWADPEQQALQQLAVRPRPKGSEAGLIRDRHANDDRGAVGFCIEALDTGDLIGSAGLWGAKLPERDAHFAIQIGPPHTSRGYGTDAVRLMVRYGFLAMGLNRIQLETFAFPSRTAAPSRSATRRNRLVGPPTRARRAYAKAGFTEEGVRREAVWIDGGFADEVIMSALRREWTP